MILAVYVMSPAALRRARASPRGDTPRCAAHALQSSAADEHDRSRRWSSPSAAASDRLVSMDARKW